MDSELRRITPSLLMMLIVVYIYLLSNPPWQTSSTATAIYSILAFLMITVSASAVNRIRTDPTPAHRIFLAGTGFASIVFTGAGIFYQLSMENPTSHTTPAGVALNLLAFAITGVIIFVSTRLEIKPPLEGSILNHRFLHILIIVISSVIFGTSVYVFRIALNDLIFLVLGFGLGVVAVVTFFLSAVMKFKQEKSLETHDSLRLGISYSLLSFASIIHVIILPAPSYLWALSMCLMGIAFIFTVSGTVYPYLKNIGVTDRISYNIGILLSAIVLLPFLVGILVDAYTPIGVAENIGASVIVHVGAAILAGSTAYTMSRRYRYPRGSYHIQIIIILLFWAVTEISVAFAYNLPLLGLVADTTTPYIVGVGASSILLTIAAKRRLSPIREDMGIMKDRFYVLGTILFGFVLVIAEIISQELSTFIPYPLFTAIGSSLLLIFSYISLFALLNLILVTAATEGDRLSFHTVISGLAATWIVVVILKANFDYWTAGFWASEVLLLSSFLMFPLIVIRLYLSENKKASEIGTRASTYSQFLSSHMAVHHAEAMDSLGKLSLDSVSDDIRLDAVSKALNEISRADEISRYLKLLLSGTKFEEDELETRDLVDAIKKGIEQVPNVSSQLLQVLSINHNQGECFVKANCLLPDIFQNIFRGVVQRIGSIQSIDVEITSTVVSLQTMWTSKLLLKVDTEDPVLKQKLFIRYTGGDSSEAIEFSYAKRIVKLYRGVFHSESRFDEGALHIEFVLKLPLIKDT